MARLVFDIETVGENFDELDETTQHVLTRWIEKDSDSEEEYEEALKDVKKELCFSPLTGRIVAIGIMDFEKNQGVVYFDAPGEKIDDFTEGDFTFKQMNEKDMLQSFWKGAERYDEFITFNGRGFDAPFLAVRSAINGIRPTKDLMEGRYLYQQRGVRHIDLQDQLTFYGAVRRKGALHLWCRAFGIKSPKDDGVSGDDVGALFRDKKYLDIARYNTADVIATKELYEYWNNYIRF